MQFCRSYQKRPSAQATHAFVTILSTFTLERESVTT